MELYAKYILAFQAESACGCVLGSVVEQSVTSPVSNPQHPYACATARATWFDTARSVLALTFTCGETMQGICANSDWRQLLGAPSGDHDLRSLGG